MAQPVGLTRSKITERGLEGTACSRPEAVEHIGKPLEEVDTHSSLGVAGTRKLEAAVDSKPQVVEGQGIVFECSR